MIQFYLSGFRCLSLWTGCCSNRDIDFISIGIPKHLLASNEKYYILFSMNKVHSPITYHFLDKLGVIFSIPESIRIMPQVSSMSWSKPILDRIALSIDHIFLGLRLPFLPIMGKFLVHIGIAPSHFPSNCHWALLSC